MQPKQQVLDRSVEQLSQNSEKDISEMGHLSFEKGGDILSKN
jgi:hypothetical protein